MSHRPLAPVNPGLRRLHPALVSESSGAEQCPHLKGCVVVPVTDGLAWLLHCWVLAGPVPEFGIDNGIHEHGIFVLRTTRDMDGECDTLDSTTSTARLVRLCQQSCYF